VIHGIKNLRVLNGGGRLLLQVQLLKAVVATAVSAEKSVVTWISPVAKLNYAFCGPEVTVAN